ncbi:hypothetical protein Pcinc_019850 [Petrolisthes cinctipes]|uniref:Uncharacterized protein n=1 Tax=Petrolisthes cinctipes TaxID=88211 RepID=A0AAE1FKF2_PETCI|nr:hypothetical protein Pcinc_019850 [Petrolisthes cinctipes]
MVMKTEEEEGEDEEVPRPPDGGWGWVVAGGVFLIALVVPMLLPSFGILFSQQLVEWRASSTTVALIFNSFMVVWRVTGVLLGSLTKEFGYRRVAMTGTLLTAVSLTLSAFATSPAFLFVFFSIGCGLGSGLSCVGYLILATYFKKHRGLANAWLMAGAGLGHFFSPLLIRLLQNNYGHQGATMIVGAIILHGFLGATVFHPVQWHSSRRKTCVRKLDVEVTSSLLPKGDTEETKNVIIKNEHLKDVLQKNNQFTICSNTSDPNNGQMGLSVSPRVTQISNVSQNTTVDTRVDKENPHCCLELCSPLKRQPTQRNNVHQNTTVTSGTNRVVEEKEYVCCRCRCCCVGLIGTVRRVACSVIKDMVILRRPSCLIIALGSTFITNGEANFTVMIPFAIQADGHTLATAAWYVSVAGICSFCTRMVLSPLSDRPWLNMRLCYTTALVLMAASIIVFTFQTSVWWQAGVMGVWGCSLGTFYGLNNLLMTKIVGVHRLTSIYSARNFLGALGFFTIGPCVGAVRDATDSYDVSMWILAAFIFTSFVMWLFMPTALAHERTNQNTTPGEDNNKA